MRCENCGFEADRDVVGSINIRLRALKMWGVTVPPESSQVAADQNGEELSVILPNNTCSMGVFSISLIGIYENNRLEGHLHKKF